MNFCTSDRFTIILLTYYWLSGGALGYYMRRSWVRLPVVPILEKKQSIGSGLVIPRSAPKSSYRVFLRGQVVVMAGTFIYYL